jgi:hypothetical protein
MSPSNDVLQCANQAAVVQVLSSEALLTKALRVPPATSNCSAGSIEDATQAAMSFPCYQMIMKSLFIASVTASTGAEGYAMCPGMDFTCNCLATIATTCPDMAEVLLPQSPPAPPAPPNCVAAVAALPLTGLSPSCSALASLFATLNTGGSPQAACPANYPNNVAVVLDTTDTGAAATAPIATPITLTSMCSALLGVPTATAPSSSQPPLPAPEAPLLPEECGAYSVISQPARRVSAPGEHSLRCAYGGGSACDDELAPGWYRFDDDGFNFLSEVVVGVYHCGVAVTGTLAPGSTHPSAAERTTQLDLCFTGAMSTCESSGAFGGSGTATVRVTNCGAYFVYRLGPVIGFTGDHNLGYCTTDVAPAAYAADPSSR